MTTIETECARVEAEIAKYRERYNLKNCACGKVLDIDTEWRKGFTERRPGCYAIFGKDSALLYIGKAKMLAHRLGTRFR
jgi:hypothetical protein